MKLPRSILLPADVPLETFESSELAQVPEVVRRAIRTAHDLAEGGVAYRCDGTMSRDELDHPPRALSCSELVYYAYARSGVDLGDAHMRTRFLAYGDPQPYAPSMVRVFDGSIRPGDLLVYHWDRAQFEQQIAERGRPRAGHVVIAVSPEKKIVIGSHGKESTPAGARTGVGYRLLPDGLGTWTRGRTLRAVYRLAAIS